MKKTILFLAVIVSLAIAGSYSFIDSQSEEKTSEKKPNILFCIADDATWKHMSAYGNTWVNTPNFDYIAENGLLFNNAYTPNAKCGPSRSIVLTGRNTWQLEEAANHLAYFPTKFKTYPEALAEQGHHVGYTGKGWSPGTALNEDGSKRELLVKRYNRIKTTPPTKGIAKVDYSANFKDFLKKRKNDEPFCFWYGGHEPHRSYEYGTGVSVGKKKLEQIDSVFSYWPDSETIRNDMLDYAFELEYFDKHLGEMLDVLRETGELDNTIIVVTSDNGMPFPRVKGLSYEHANHLPLAIMWKDGIKNPNREIDDYVSFIDFAATFMDVSGYDATDLGMQPLQGKSLVPLFSISRENNKSDEQDYVLLGQERHDVGRPNDVGYPVRGIIKDDFMYLINFEEDRWPAGNPETGYTNTDGSPTKTEILEMNRQGKDQKFWQLNFGKKPHEELYHVTVDEDCTHNLAQDEDYQARKQEMKEILLTELKKQKDPRMFGNGDIFDNYPPDRNAGFYERYMRGEEVKSGWINDSDFERSGK